MHKQERAKAGLKSRQLKVIPPPRSPRPLPPHLYKCGGKLFGLGSLVRTDPTLPPDDSVLPPTGPKARLP